MTDVLTDLLDTMRLGTLVYGRLELGAPWGFQLPDRGAAHIVVVGRGSARLEVDGRRAPLNLSAGDVVFVPRGGSHILRDSKGSALFAFGESECRSFRDTRSVKLSRGGLQTVLVVCAFQFRAAHSTFSMQRLARSIHVPATHAARPPWFASTVEQFVAESSSQEPGAMVVMSRLADVLLVQTIRFYIAGNECAAHGLRALSDRSIARALALIHERPADGWTVEKLAQSAGLSRSGFAERFRALVGDPPLEYLARWRMTKAAELLRDSDLAMIDVAERVGYRSEASFHRAFKRLEGVTPGAFRRRFTRASSPASGPRTA
ncbi:AraC family transcriptional regulator [Bradyrhizobium lablabi]|uniref:AraC family transcriptional regulator n=1 Tax=Bradyrhizobium lablabi TaxID=722472 RepID=A0A0R3MYE2_9BRAD|nr:AraC family transcriptional regulator [Bradyrhizobium lablabi]KRR24827.1 AraC family transcriptional regulator [Bradyrhizobium lablabi]